MKLTTLKEIPIILLGLVWIVFIFLDYWNKHPFYSLSFEHYKLQNFTIFLVALGIVVAALYQFVGKATIDKPSGAKKVIPKGTRGKYSFLFSGLSFFIISLFISIGITYAFTAFAEGSVQRINAGQSVFIHALTYTGKGIVNFLELVLIFFSVFSIGYQALQIVDFDIRESSRTIYSTVIGIMLFTFVMFILAIVGLLYNFILLPLLIIPIAINWRKNLSILKDVSITNVFDKDSKLNFLTGLLITGLIALITINFLSCMGPFPSGFDSRNYYVNISKLLEDYNGLVEGFQPYSWSLFMSLGNIAFNDISLTLLISFSGFLLSLWAIWEICRSYFRFSVNHSLFILLLLCTVPAIFNQFYVEQKIDFGLLFVQLCSVLLLVDIVDKIKGANEFRVDKELIRLFVLLGIFSGFALGIKATHLYMLFAIVIMLWTIYCGYYGFLAAFFFTLFVVFIGRLDDVSGLREYHLGISYLKYIVLTLSLVFFGLSIYKDRLAFISSFKTSAVLALVALIVFTPWIIKNYSDNSSSISINKLIMGDNPGPGINATKMIRNYERSKKKK